MRYTYEVYDKGSDDTEDAPRVHVCTRIDDVNNDYCDFDRYRVEVSDNLNRDEETFAILTLEEWQEWCDKVARDFAWKPHKMLPPAVHFRTAVDKAIEGIDELPEKGKKYSVEDDGFHEIPEPSMSMYERKEEFEKDYQMFTENMAKRVGKQLMDNDEESRILEEMLETKQGLQDAINPPHYQNFLDQYQWIETMCRIQRFRDNPEQFEAAIELQVRKYLDRCGRKDERLQELEKALWYMKFLVAYVKNGSVPILVEDVEEILWIGKD
jgi:hypothetical protein